jgi:asparagine synthase (glutamine-hydrolysing)
MSGICGLIGSVSTPKPGHLVAAMLKAIAHRGPDGANFFSSEESGVALGHNHLKTFAAAAGFAETDAVAVALDGGVTNRAAIGAAAPVRANPDTQAVLAAYQAHGEDFLSRLDGPFSLALWDKQKRRLILSRDNLGEKSLYYYFDPQQETLVFASEIKAILAHPAVRTELDWDSLSLYFAFGYIPGPRTLFKGIFKLLPGESLQWGFSRPLEKRKYWHLPHIADGVDDEAYCIRQLKELFMQGLAAYVNGCQDVAVFLSGGVNSSIIVAGLRELGVPHVHTFTVGFRVNSANSQIEEDLPCARMVAEKFGTAHHEILIAPNHKPGLRLLRVIRQFDDLIMTPNIYSKYLLAEAVREAGLSSVLTGSADAGACSVHRKFLDPQKRAKLLKKTQECATDEQRYYKLRSRLFDLEVQRQFLRPPPLIAKPDILAVLHLYIGDIKSDDFFRLFLFANLMITSTEKTCAYWIRPARSPAWKCARAISIAPWLNFPRNCRHLLTAVRPTSV